MTYGQSGAPAGRIGGIVAASVIGIVGVVLAVMAIWNLGWFAANAANTRAYQLHQKQVDQQAHLAQGNYGTQEGYITAISNDVAAVDSEIVQIPGAPNAAVLKVAALGYAQQACQEANLLTGSVPVPASMQSWIKANCSAGSVSLDSPIRNGKGN